MALHYFQMEKTSPNRNSLIKSTLTTKPVNFTMQIRRQLDKGLTICTPKGALIESAQKHLAQVDAKRTVEVGLTNVK